MAAADILRKPLNVAEGEGIITGGIIPKPIRDAFSFVLKYLFGTIKLLFGLFILFLIIWVPYRLFFVTGGGAALITHGSAAAEQSGLPGLQKYASAAGLDFLFGDPSKVAGYGFESDIDKSQPLAQNAGVKVIKLEEEGKPEYGKPIKVRGILQAAAALQDIDVVVDCQLDDSDLIPAIIGGTTVSGNTARIFKGAQETLEATCVFPKGLTPASGTPLIFTGKARMYATYSFTSRASHRTYFLNAQAIQEFRRKGQEAIDIFKTYGVYGKDPQLQSDGKVRAVASPGPVTVAIGTDASQPFAENTPYTFGITLSNNADWNGQLKKIEYAEVQVPFFLRLEGDQDYPQQFQTGAVTCPLAFTQETGKNDFRIYRLKTEVVSNLNRACDKKTLEQLQVSQQDCVDLLGTDRDKTFRCAFVSTRPSETLEYDIIRAETKYEYQTQRVIGVEAIRPIPNIV